MEGSCDEINLRNLRHARTSYGEESFPTQRCIKGTPICATAMGRELHISSHSLPKPM
jgi:hypothetical protein